jgi:hypothetical protein
MEEISKRAHSSIVIASAENSLPVSGGTANWEVRCWRALQEALYLSCADFPMKDWSATAPNWSVPVASIYVERMRMPPVCSLFDRTKLWISSNAFCAEPNSKPS